MAVYEIPIDGTYPSFIQEVELEGTSYRMEFRWNARESEWYLTLRDIDDVVLAGSRKLVTGAGLLRLVHAEDRPPGDLFVVNTIGDGQSSPGRDDLGSKLVLVYLDEEEVATARTATVTELGGIVVHGEMRMKTAAAKGFSAGVWDHCGGTWEAGLLQDFEFDTPGRLTYIGVATRTFLVQLTFGLVNNAAGDTSIGIAKNSTDPGSTEFVKEDDLPAASDKIVSISRLMQLASGDFIEPYLKLDDTDNATVNTGVLTVIG